jgi:DnaK suppressor protein
MGQTLYYLESDIFETMTLTANKEYYKNLLMKKLTAFSAELRSTIDGMTDVSEKNPDLSDMATAESNTSFALSLRERESQMVAEIAAALERIEKGIYGICEECGEEISEGRLKVAPETTLCIDCKREQEFA